MHFTAASLSFCLSPVGIKHKAANSALFSDMNRSPSFASFSMSLAFVIISMASINLLCLYSLSATSPRIFFLALSSSMERFTEAMPSFRIFSTIGCSILKMSLLGFEPKRTGVPQRHKSVDALRGIKPRDRSRLCCPLHHRPEDYLNFIDYLKLFNKRTIYCRFLLNVISIVETLTSLPDRKST